MIFQVRQSLLCPGVVHVLLSQVQEYYMYKPVCDNWNALRVGTRFVGRVHQFLPGRHPYFIVDMLFKHGQDQ